VGDAHPATLRADDLGKKITGSICEENAPAKPSKKKRDVF